MRRSRLALATIACLLFATAWAVGCGGDDNASGGSPPDGGAVDTGLDTGLPPPPVDSGLDAGADVFEGGGNDASYPAFKPDIGQIVNQGGFVSKSPKLVTVTWLGDPNAATYEAFGDAIGASSYWTTTTTEYGIGPLSTNTHVRIAMPDAGITPIDGGFAFDENNLDSFIVSQVSDPTSGWPAPDHDTMYILYTPPNLDLTVNGQDDCPNNDGYHTETTNNTDAGAHIIYSIAIQYCPVPQGVALTDNTTETASHEIVEGFADPDTGSDLAWTGYDTNHWSWEIWQGFQDEIGDGCEFYTDAYYTESAPFAYAVQRMWSNKSAAAGHSPCVPVPAYPYFNATPIKAEPISVSYQNLDGTTGNVNTTGFRIGVGQTRTFQVGLYSDAPVPDWQIQAVEGDGVSTPLGLLNVTTDKSSGNNGDLVNVTVTVKGDIAQDGGTPLTGILMTVVSSDSNSASTHYMPLLIGAY